MSRKSKISAKLITNICMYRSEGASWRQVAEEIGIPRSTLHDWLKKGENAKQDSLYKQLHEALMCAEAGYVLEPFATLKDRATKPCVKIKRKETVPRDGKILTITETTTILEPSAQAALKLLRSSSKYRKIFDTPPQQKPKPKNSPPEAYQTEETKQPENIEIVCDNIP